MIETGAIMVNGVIVTELGTKVMPTDEVRYGDKILQREKPVYLLLNKPKDYITTMDDERIENMFFQLIKGLVKKEFIPLEDSTKHDRVLLFTNGGEMAKKLHTPNIILEKYIM